MKLRTRVLWKVTKPEDIWKEEFIPRDLTPQQLREAIHQKRFYKTALQLVPKQKPQ